MDSDSVVMDGEEFRICKSKVQGRLGLKMDLMGLGFLAGMVLLVRKAYKEGSLPWFLGILGGLQLLRMNKAVSQKAESFIIPAVMSKVDHYFLPVRQELFKGIKGEVLDLGCGDGPYLQYYVASREKGGAGVTRAVMLEPNEKLQPALQKNVDAALRKSPELKVEVTSCFIQDLPGEQIFDCVVFGNVLCEVPNQEEVFRHVERLLKPGGRVYFCEHTLGTSKLTRAAQHVASPFWLCHCNRDSVTHLSQQPWVKELKSWDFALNFPVSRWQLGLALKR